MPDLLVAISWIDEQDRQQVTIQEALDGALDDVDAPLLAQLQQAARLVTGYQQDEQLELIEAAVKNSLLTPPSDSVSA